MGRWIVLLGVVVVALAGCASPAKPTPMPKEAYAEFGGILYGLNQCIRQGSISPELGALGLRYVQNNINSYWHSPLALSNAVKDYEKEGAAVTQAYCNEMATAVAGRKQEIDIHNAWVDDNRQALQNQINQINQNRPVICNQVGTYTMCQ